MTASASVLEYERAGEYRDVIRGLQEIERRQLAIDPTGGDLDVVAVARDGDEACGVIFKIRARMAQKPGAEPPELHTWFWGETSAGQMVAAIAEHMKSSGDEALERIANGIAR